MPLLGFGVFESIDAKASVLEALKAGYRLIDSSFTDNLLISDPKTDTSTLLSIMKMKQMWQRPLELQGYLEKKFLSVCVEIICYPAFALISCDYSD